jgi:hypothetical protein
MSKHGAFGWARNQSSVTTNPFKGTLWMAAKGRQLPLVRRSYRSKATALPGEIKLSPSKPDDYQYKIFDN